MTRKEAVERSGLPAGTIARRIWAGWPPERLFDPAARHRYRPRKPGGARAARLFTTPYGQLTLAEIAAIVGIAPKAMQMRLTTYRWSQEEAFNTPKHAARGPIRYCLSPNIGGAFKRSLLALIGKIP